MQTEKETTSDDKMGEMVSSMGSYLVNKLKKRIESIQKRLEEIKKSKNPNKTEIEKKLVELIKVMTTMTEKTELQNKTQKEMLDLMEIMGKLDTEIDDLLIKDGD